MMARVGIAFCAVLATCATALAEPQLAFERDGKIVKQLDLRSMQQVAPPREVATLDPYYKKQKRFSALPLLPLLEAAFGADKATLQKQQFVLRAKDGYAVPVAGARLLEGGAAIAFADRDGKWEPIGPQRADPAPFYLVWEGADQRELESHPRPWQLAAIAIVSFESLYAHAVPPPTASPAAQRGAAIFRERCIRCHAINREGGRIGPDLNVPQAILEYRPEAQVRAYIQNPLTFRYSVMPPNPDLSAQALSDLVAYFSAMQRQKHDPDSRKPGAPIPK